MKLQAEVGGHVVAKTDCHWQRRWGRVLSSELYDGECYNAGLKASRDWQPMKEIRLPPHTVLIAPEAPPIRQICFGRHHAWPNGKARPDQQICSRQTDR